MTRLNHHELSIIQQTQLDCCQIWAHLIDRNWNAAELLLDKYPQKAEEKNPLDFLHGCWLCATQGKDAATLHFSSLPSAFFPPTWALFSHFTKNNKQLQTWRNQAFFWEKRHLYRQAVLFYHCAGDLKESQRCQLLEEGLLEPVNPHK